MFMNNLVRTMKFFILLFCYMKIIWWFNSNTLVVGKVRDETAGLPIKEFLEVIK